MMPPLSDIEFQNKLDKFTDRYLQSSFSLWTAILTINGILMAAFFSFTPIESSSNIFVVCATILCVLSIIGILYNFYAAKASYYRIGIVINGIEELSSETRQKDIKRSLFRQKLMVLLEKICLLFLAIESILILTLIIDRYAGQ